jgi:hypothetical protein
MAEEKNTTEEKKEEIQEKKKLSQVTFRVEPDTIGKEILDMLEYRQKKGLSKDMSDMQHQIWNFIKRERNTQGSFKTGKW